MTIEKELVSALNGIVGIQQYLVGLPERETVGAQIVKSAPFAEFKAGRSDMATIELKTAITSTGAANDRLVPSMVPAIDPGTRRTLSVRDLLRSFPTQNGAIEMPVKTASTNSAAPQVGNSPLQRENVALGESAYTFENSFIPVQTIGHFVPVSSQVFEDAGTLDGFIQGEMQYGLQLAIEDQLLNGDGSTGQLTGLLSEATAYAPTSPQMSNEIDILRHAIYQIQVANFNPDAVLLNPADLYDIDTRKATTSGNAYAASLPRSMNATRIWGLPVYVSNSITSGTFLVGDFARCGAVFVRQGATVQIARHDSDNFQRNMLTIKAMERLALVVSNPLALVTGSL